MLLSCEKCLFWSLCPPRHGPVGLKTIDSATGLSPKAQYQVYLTDTNQEPFGKLEPLAVLKTNPDGAGIVQAIGPLKTLATNDPNSSASKRFLIVTDIDDSSHVVLRQAKAQKDSP